GKVYTRDISVLTYEEFGAKGDGVSDDFFAIKAAHDAANEGGQLVMATSGKTYRIHDTRDSMGVVNYVDIRTNVIWTGAKFIIDDTDFSTFDGTGVNGLDLFIVSMDTPTVKITDSEVLSAIVAAGFNREVDHIKLPEIDYPVLIIPYNNSHKVYRRPGFGSYTGQAMHELIVLDENGKINDETALFFDYNALDELVIYPLVDEHITIEGGHFVTKASHVNILQYDIKGNCTGCRNGYFERGIEVQRPFTTVKNVEHYVEGEVTLAEQAEGIFGPTYNGFFCASFTTNVTFENCVMTGRRCFRKNNIPGAGSGTSGSYDYSLHEANKVVFLGCTQSNFWITIDQSTGEIKAATEDTPGATLSMTPTSFGGINFQIIWGIGGSNYTKNMEFINSTISRFDAHAGIMNGKIINSSVTAVSLVGGGEMLLENVNWYGEGQGDCDSIVGMRSDYSSPWDGTIILKDVTAHVSPNNPFSIVGHGYTNWYAGYESCYPNVVIDGLNVLYDENDPRYGSTEIMLMSVGVVGKVGNQERFLPGVLVEPQMHLPETQNTPPKYADVDHNKDGIVDGTDFNGNGVLDTDEGELGHDGDIDTSGVIATTKRYNLNPIRPPKFIEIRSNPNGYTYLVPDTSGVASRALYGVPENMGGFFGCTTFYYTDASGNKQSILGTATNVDGSPFKFGYIEVLH
ncbi:MAG: hypothetical protein J6V09_07170, partial [Clostridia bacterium]|nr:hypothetical protein [Clostridia bacterium]